MATYVRPITLLLPVLVAFVLFVLLKRDLKRALALTLVFASVFVLTLSPWLARNYLVFHKPSFSTVGSYSFLLNHVAYFEIGRSGESYESMKSSLVSEAEDLMRRDGFSPDRLSDFEKTRYWRELSFQKIKANPLQFASYCLRSLFISFANLGTRDYTGMLQPGEEIGRFDIKIYPNLLNLVKQWFQQKRITEISLGAAVAFYLVVSYICLAAGFYAGSKQDSKAFLFFCLMLFLYFIPTSMAAGGVRYRLPAIPFYLSFTGIGLAFLSSKIESLRGMRQSRKNHPLSHLKR